VESDELAGMREYSRFVWGMYYLRHRFPGMSCTSWGRSPAHNKTLPGSVGDSAHLEWLAADVTWDPGTQPDIGVLHAAARSVGLIAIRETTHDHLERTGATVPVGG
jgi:hypothetical protein